MSDSVDATRSKSRTERKRDERIRLLLTATAEALGASGYAALNLEDVAERLDLAKGTIYYYFPTKEALVSACIEKLGDEFTSRLESVAEQSAAASSLERLSLLIAEQLRIALAEPHQVLSMFVRPKAWPESHRELLKSFRTRHAAVFRDVVLEGLESGEFQVASVDMALRCLFGSLNYAPTWYRGTTPEDLETVIKQMSATLTPIFVAHDAPGRPA